MTLDSLSEDVTEAYGELDEDLTVSLDRETRNELAMLETALQPESTDELLRRAVHMLFQNTVETGTLDFHLRSGYDVTYDEYLMDMSMNSHDEYGQTGDPDDRRYQF